MAVSPDAGDVIPELLSFLRLFGSSTPLSCMGLLLPEPARSAAPRCVHPVCCADTIRRNKVCIRYFGDRRNGVRCIVTGTI